MKEVNKELIGLVKDKLKLGQILRNVRQKKWENITEADVKCLEAFSLTDYMEQIDRDTLKFVKE